MAIAGDIIIKLAADFAEFAAGMLSATKSLGDFGKKVDEQNDTLKGIAKSLTDLGKSNSVEAFTGKLEALGKSFVKFGLIGAAAAAVIGTIVAAISKVREIEDYALKVDKLATSFKLTTVQAQALEAAARQTGKTAEELNTALSANEKKMLGDSFKAAFGDNEQIIKDIAAASLTLSDAFNDLSEASKQSMIAMFGGLTEAALNYLTQAIKDWTAAIRGATDYLSRLPQRPSQAGFNANRDAATVVGIAGEFGVLAQPMSEVPSDVEVMQSQMLALEKTLKSLKEQKADTEATLGRGLDPSGYLANDLKGINEQIDITIAKLAKLGITVTTAIKGLPDLSAYLSPGADPSKDRGGIGPYIPGNSQRVRWTIEDAMSRQTKTGGGGSNTDSDGIEAQIKRYDALAAAAEKAGKTIAANSDKNFEDLQREVRVQQQIDEIAGKLGAKYDKASDAQKAQLKTSITLAEVRKSADEQALASIQAAQEIEVKYGDGMAARLKMEIELNRAKSAGVASTEALARAEKERAEQAEHQRLQATRTDNDLGSLAAGFQDAALSYQRANDMFSQGGALFSATTSAMGEGLDALLGKSNKTFDQIAADFALMLTKMALQAAASQVFKLIFNSFGSGGGATPPVLSDTGGFGPTSTARAGGGSVYGGQSYWVGEYGPERFVPQAAGNIQPAGGGGDVFVSINNYTDSAVSTKKSKGPGGQVQVDVIVEAVEGRMAARLSRGQGALGRTMQGTYGLQPVGR